MLRHRAERADVDYLFLQAFVDQPLVSGAQGCGNILAGVGPAAIEGCLFAARGEETEVRIQVVNPGEVAVARIQTPQGCVNCVGKTEIAAGLQRQERRHDPHRAQAVRRAHIRRLIPDVLPPFANRNIAEDLLPERQQMMLREGRPNLGTRSELQSIQFKAIARPFLKLGRIGC